MSASSFGGGGGGGDDDAIVKCEEMEVRSGGSTDSVDRSMREINGIQELSARYRQPDTSQIYDDDMLEQDTTIDEDLNSLFEGSVCNEFLERFPKVDKDLIQSYNELVSPERQIRLRNDLQTITPRCFTPGPVSRSKETNFSTNQYNASEGIQATPDSDFEEPIQSPRIDLQVLYSEEGQMKNLEPPSIFEEKKGKEESLVPIGYPSAEDASREKKLRGKRIPNSTSELMTYSTTSPILHSELQVGPNLDEPGTMGQELGKLPPKERYHKRLDISVSTPTSSDVPAGRIRSSTRLKKKVIPFDMLHGS